MIKKFHPSWASILESEFNKDYFKKLVAKIEEASNSNTVFPPEDLVFNAFNITSLDQTKVVIIGQDPYHNTGQAHGLAFSVPYNEKIPPSLRNIYTELLNDIGKIPPHHGNLTHWAESGVLLLNTALTVTAHKAGSHSKWGWLQFSQNIIQKISTEKKHVVFILWGNHAQQLEEYIANKEQHLILKSPHPSPLSARTGFWNNKHFSTTNAYLIKHNLQPINW